MISPRCFIFADDLTGAADSAVAFARQGLATEVIWDARVRGLDDTAVLAFDTNSRALTADAAATRHRDLVAALDDSALASAALFKKIDSTLRGHPAAEIAAMGDALLARTGAAFGICAPAYPATHRTTVNGHVRLNGKPLEEAEIWRREHSYPTADLVGILASAGVVARGVPLAQVRGAQRDLAAALTAIREQGARNGGIVAVCDAETQQDLDAIVAASEDTPAGRFYIGSGGLAHSLAPRVARRATVRSAAALSERTAGALFVVGSLSSLSRTAAAELARQADVRHLRATPAMLLDEASPEARDAFGAQALADIRSGHDVLVDIALEGEPDPPSSPRLAHALTGALRSAASQASALFATGGETAAALLGVCGVESIRLWDELEPGICLGFTRGAVQLPVVTKAGAFGNSGSLTRVARRFARMKQTGKVQ
jgi:uncharacterized protein YgbK (DUF1537 family)